MHKAELQLQKHAVPTGHANTSFRLTHITCLRVHQAEPATQHSVCTTMIICACIFNMIVQYIYIYMRVFLCDLHACSYIYMYIYIYIHIIYICAQVLHIGTVDSDQRETAWRLQLTVTFKQLLSTSEILRPPATSHHH